MNVEIVVPALGESVSVAIIARWNKKPGDIINIDDLLLELETEKVTLEVNSPVSGVLDKILKSQGDTVLTGEAVGLINENVGPKTETSAISSQIIKKNDLLTNMPQSSTKLILENNLSPINITSLGQDSTNSKEGVLNYFSNQSAPVEQLASTTTNKDIERVKMSLVRKTIAKRLKDSQNTAVILTTFNEIDITNTLALRQKYRKEFEKKHGIKLGFMSFFVKASVAALKIIPSINAEIDGNDIVYKNYYDIGVAMNTEQGLVVPVVRGGDQLTFSGIEKEITNLGIKAKEGKLSIADLSGATFSISNGGIYGSLLSTPIINPPQSGILGLHKIQERPIAINGKVEVRSMMYIALSYDHRIVDGKEAITFLVNIKEAIENPERLLLNI